MVTVTVLAVEGDQVKLGITAPREIPIHRQEIYEQIKKANIEAAESSPADLSSVAKLLPPH
jgi:carbon storage regulator